MNCSSSHKLFTYYQCRHKDFKTSGTINPILHEGRHIVPSHVDNLLCCFCGCPKWAHFSWVCYLQHLPSPIEAIFKKKIEKIEKLKRIKFYFSKTSGKISQKFLKNAFFTTDHALSTWIWFLYVFSFLFRYITYVLVKILNFLVFYQ